MRYENVERDPVGSKKRGVDLAYDTTATPGYNELNANIAYTRRMGGVDLTYFLLAKHMLNQDIRLSSSVLKDMSPLPGRNFVFGVRAKF